jgi:UDPglucose 6-dehydrogenase
MWSPKYGTQDYGPFSGSCLPKDTSAFLQFATKELKVDMKILRAVIQSNEELKKKMMQRGK